MNICGDADKERNGEHKKVDRKTYSSKQETSEPGLTVVSW